MSDTRRRKRCGRDLYRKVRRAIEQGFERFPWVDPASEAGFNKGRANRKARRALILEARREVGR